MAKKNFLKTVVGIGAVAVAGKIAYDRFKSVREDYEIEEFETAEDEVKKYNALCQKKEVIEDELFTGCEIKNICSSTIIDLGMATFEQDTYINFTSTCGSLEIIVPEGVNVVLDVDSTLSSVKSVVDNVDEEGIKTVYLIGKAVLSEVVAVPMNFYMDEDDDFEE